MKILHLPIILLSFILFTCENSAVTNETKAGKENPPVVSTPEKQVRQKTEPYVIPDSIKRFVVDDYPITSEMMRINMRDLTIRSGKSALSETVWFTNNSIGQTIVINYATDYHRFYTYHFYNDSIPLDLLKEMKMHFSEGKELSEKQKLKDFPGFIRQAAKTDSVYFKSGKGFRLGDPKEKAVKIYGKPDIQTTRSEIEKVEWEFVGDYFYDGKIDLKNKPLAKDNFGHKITMYFKDGRLVGQILFNDIP